MRRKRDRRPKNPPANRINPRITSVTWAAHLLIQRHGKQALQEASNRYDRAETEATASYYENVMTAITKQWADEALAKADAAAKADLHDMLDAAGL